MFTKDDRTQRFLTSMGAEWEYSNNSTPAMLAPGWDQENLARPVPIREDAVMEYSTLMDQGSPAPAPILGLRPDGLWDVLDGVQRLTAAFMLGVTQFSSYNVTSDSSILLLTIRLIANARLQGHQEPVEVSKRQAVQILIIDKGMSPGEVARAGGWNTKEIEKLVVTMDWGFRIRAIGGPNLPDTVINVVAKNIPSAQELNVASEPISAFLHIVKETKFSGENAEPYIEEFFKPIVKKSKKHGTYSGRVEDFREDPEVQMRLGGRKGGKTEEHMLFRRGLKTAETHLDNVIKNGDELLNVDEFYKILNRITKKVKKYSARGK